MSCREVKKKMKMKYKGTVTYDVVSVSRNLCPVINTLVYYWLNMHATMYHDNLYSFRLVIDDSFENVQF